MNDLIEARGNATKLKVQSPSNVILVETKNPYATGFIIHNNHELKQQFNLDLMALEDSRSPNALILF